MRKTQCCLKRLAAVCAKQAAAGGAWAPGRVPSRRSAVEGGWGCSPRFHVSASNHTHKPPAVSLCKVAGQCGVVRAVQAHAHLFAQGVLPQGPIAQPLQVRPALHCSAACCGVLALPRSHGLLKARKLAECTPQLTCTGKPFHIKHIHTHTQKSSMWCACYYSPACRPASAHNSSSSR